jgi:hypothetical protein
MPVDEYRLLLAVRVIKEFAWNILPIFAILP